MQLCYNANNYIAAYNDLSTTILIQRPKQLFNKQTEKWATHNFL